MVNTANNMKNKITRATFNEHIPQHRTTEKEPSRTPNNTTWSLLKHVLRKNPYLNMTSVKIMLLFHNYILVEY
jgi:hypothetical protein